MLWMACGQRERQAWLRVGRLVRTCYMRERHIAIMGRPSGTAVDNGEIQFYRAVRQFQYSREKRSLVKDNDGF